MIEPFLRAIEWLKRKNIFPSPMNSAQWQSVAPAIRQVSFFSATVDKAKVLTGYRNMLLDWAENAVEEVDGPYGKQIAYKIGNQAQFVEQARDLLIKEGLMAPEEIPGKKLSDINSAERLKLVFNTNIQQSQQFAIWQSKVENPDYINLFPAARFVRMPGATTPRPRHVAAEGEVRRWDDFEFWLYQNAADIGGFEVPWGPFGFNSYMRQEPVKRKEAERLGLVKPGEIIQPINAKRWGVNPAQTIKNNAKANLRSTPLVIRQQAISEMRNQFGSDFVDDNGKISLAAFQKLREAARTNRG